MNRTKNIQIGNRYDGKRVYKSIYYPNIPISDTDVYITSKPNTFLDVLSYEYYGNSELWWIISRANNIQRGSISVEPGIQLRIPTDISLILQSYTNLNG